MREGVPFKIDSVEKMILKEEDELRSLIYEEVEDNLDIKVKLEVMAEIIARHFDIKYEHDEFEHDAVIGIVDGSDENNSFLPLLDLSKELTNEIRIVRRQIKIIGIQAFTFKLIIFGILNNIILIITFLELWNVKIGSLKGRGLYLLCRGLYLLWSIVLFFMLFFAWFVGCFVLGMD